MEYISQKQIVEGLIVELSAVIPPSRLVKMKEYPADKRDEIRLTLIREEFNNKKFIDENYYQLSKCNEIECYSNSCTINGIEFETQTDIIEVSIPPLITGVGWSNILYLGDQNISKRFSRVSMASFIKYTPQYSKPSSIYTLVGNKIYLRNMPTKGMKFVTGSFLFQVPSTACSWNNTDHYPVPSSYKLKFLIKRDLLALQPSPQPKQEENENKKTQQDE